MRNNGFTHSNSDNSFHFGECREIPPCRIHRLAHRVGALAQEYVRQGVRAARTAAEEVADFVAHPSVDKLIEHLERPAVGKLIGLFELVSLVAHLAGLHEVSYVLDFLALVLRIARSRRARTAGHAIIHRAIRSVRYVCIRTMHALRTGWRRLSAAARRRW
ncbi:hypothetical protein [Nocardia sp. NPDC004711]